MKLQPQEKVIKVFHHHPFFFITRGLKIWVASLPFFLMAFFVGQVFDVFTQIGVYFGIIVLFSLVHIYDFTIYYLDTLVVTNKRVIHLDWFSLFRYVETQAMLDDIQNIETEETGFFSRFDFFDFGVFLLETASTRTTINFKEAPDPEGIKYFLYNLAKRQHKLKTGKSRIDEGKGDFIKKAENELSKVEKVG